VEQTSTSLFDFVIWINFLVSLYCCESTLPVHEINFEMTQQQQ